MTLAGSTLLRLGSSLLVAVVWTLAGSLYAASPDLSWEATDGPILEGLEALHQGRFTTGRERFEEFIKADPLDPRGHLFLALCEWWRQLELENSSPSSVLEHHLDESIRLGREFVKRRGDDPRALATLGTAYIFLAQYKASQKKGFRAAFLAKKGKRYLEEAVDLDSSVVDSQFALGAYNYYADKVNLLVKGLRTLLFLPGGNSEKGLKQLEEVAARGRYFRTEAHLLLAIIYQGPHENRYLRSLEHLRFALTLNEGSPLILASIGEFQLRVGRYPEAQASLLRCLRSLERAEDPDQSRLKGSVRVLLAESLELALQSEEALRELERLEPGAGSLPGKVRQRALVVAARAGGREGDPQRLKRVYRLLGVRPDESSWLQRHYQDYSQKANLTQALEPALRLLEAGEAEAARKTLEEVRPLYPANPELRLHLARAWMVEKNWQGAERILRTLPDTKDGELPIWIRGWRDLYLGRALMILGRRHEAEKYYRRASETRGFRSRDLARALLGPEQADSRLWPARVFGLALDEVEDPPDVGAGLPVRRNTTRAVHRPFPRVVGG